MTDEDQNFEEFINSFLNSFSHLFTLLGVFGGVSVYLTAISTEMPTNSSQQAIRLGIVSSLILFSLTSILILRIYVDEYKKFNSPLFAVTDRKKAIPLFIFTIFLALVVSIAAIVIGFSGVFFSLLLLVLLTASMIFTLNSIVHIALDIKDRLPISGYDPGVYEITYYLSLLVTIPIMIILAAELMYDLLPDYDYIDSILIILLLGVGTASSLSMISSVRIKFKNDLD